MATVPWLNNGKKAVLRAILAIALSGTLSAGRNQWTPVGPEGGFVSALTADPRSPSTVYAATCSGVFKTIDAGAIWTAMNSGLPNDGLPWNPDGRSAKYRYGLCVKRQPNL